MADNAVRQTFEGRTFSTVTPSRETTGPVSQFRLLVHPFSPPVSSYKITSASESVTIVVSAYLQTRIPHPCL